ncbi:MAG: thiamine pyrophosphate-dependent enzyme, partial [Planctomycetota bacterium]
ADDARRYREQDEVDSWLAKDPLIRTRLYLEQRKVWTETLQQDLEAKAKKIVDEVVRAAETIDDPHMNDSFDSMFAGLPAEMLRQRETLRTSSLGQTPDQIGLNTKPEAVH